MALSSYDIHMQKLNVMKEELEFKRIIGVNPDPQYTLLKYNLINNKIKVHEFQEQGRSF